MGTLQEQQRAYEEAVAFYENIKADPNCPYKLSEQEKRSYGALFNHSSYGAFRHAPQEATKSLGTREKQAWEGLGNITKVESMRRFVEKVKKLKIDYDLAVKNAELSK